MNDNKKLPNEKFLFFKDKLQFKHDISDIEQSELISLLQSNAFSDEENYVIMDLIGRNGGMTLFAGALSSIHYFDENGEIDEVEKNKFITLLHSKEKALPYHFEIERLFFDISYSTTASLVQNYLANKNWTRLQKRSALKTMADNDLERILSTLFEREIYGNGPSILASDIDLVYKKVSNIPILLYIDESNGGSENLSLMEKYRADIERLKQRPVMSRLDRERVRNFDKDEFTKVYGAWGTDIDLFKALQNGTIDIETLSKSIKTPNRILYLAKYLTGKKIKEQISPEKKQTILDNLSDNIKFSKSLKPSVFMPFLSIEGTNASGVSIALACSNHNAMMNLSKHQVELLTVAGMKGAHLDCMADVIDRAGSLEAVTHFILFHTPNENDHSEKADNLRDSMRELEAGCLTDAYTEMMQQKISNFSGSTPEEIETYRQAELLRLRKIQMKEAVSRGEGLKEVGKSWLSQEEREIVCEELQTVPTSFGE